MVKKYASSSSKRKKGETCLQDSTLTGEARCKKTRLSDMFYVSESEDGFSIQKHVETMKKEVKKPVSRRITTLICDRLNKTRSIRQEEVKQLVPVKELLEKYAPLGEGNGIIEEIDAMRKIDCLKLIQDKKFLFLMQQAKQKLAEFVQQFMTSDVCAAWLWHYRVFLTKITTA